MLVLWGFLGVLIVESILEMERGMEGKEGILEYVS